MAGDVETESFKLSAPAFSAGIPALAKANITGCTQINSNGDVNITKLSTFEWTKYVPTIHNAYIVALSI